MVLGSSGKVGTLLAFSVSYLVFSFLATAFHEYAHYVVLQALGGEGRVYFRIEPIFLPWDASSTFIIRPPSSQLGFLIFSASGGALTAILLTLIYWREKNISQRAALIFVIFHQSADAVSEPLLQLTTLSSFLKSTLISYQLPLLISMLFALLYVARLGRLGRR